MQAEMLAALEIRDGRAVNEQPLLAWNFRFHVQTRQWKKVGVRHNRMPRNVKRSVVAQETGIPEENLLNWESAVIREPGGEGEGDPSQRLKVLAGEEIAQNPLLPWGFEFFPASNTWRRARASRNEVSRSQVAKKVGVTEEQLVTWETAITQDFQRKSA